MIKNFSLHDILDIATYKLTLEGKTLDDIKGVKRYFEIINRIINFLDKHPEVVNAMINWNGLSRRMKCYYTKKYLKKYIKNLNEV